MVRLHTVYSEFRMNRLKPQKKKTIKNLMTSCVGCGTQYIFKGNGKVEIQYILIDLKQYGSSFIKNRMKIKTFMLF